MTEEREHTLREAFSLFRDTLFSVDDGWFTVLSELGLRAEGLPFRVVEAKEKFGILRIYYCRIVESEDENYDALDEQMRMLVSKAELDSSSVCELCGSPGRRVLRGGWISARCFVCVPSEVV
jgi:hypothetical protein